VEIDREQVEQDQDYDGHDPDWQCGAHPRSHRLSVSKEERRHRGTDEQHHHHEEREEHITLTA
jgi:hypothetical protein